MAWWDIPLEYAVMSMVAILGAGPLGATIAHKLAERARVREICLIDESAAVAAGKALDIRQSGPVDGYDTRLSATGDALAAAGADAIVIADRADGTEWDGESGLALVGRLARAGTRAPFVFAGPRQLWLIEAAARELKLPADRLIGTASSALVNAVAALTGVELGLAGVNVSVGGRPPAFVIGWSSATVSGSLVTDRVPAHRLLAISRALPKLWPPGPQAIAAPTALATEALISGSRRLHHAVTVLAGELGVSGVGVMLPLELGRGRVLQRVVPSFSPQEKTELLNSLQHAKY
jgi:malate dehydrogenase